MLGERYGNAEEPTCDDSYPIYSERAFARVILKHCYAPRLLILGNLSHKSCLVTSWFFDLSEVYGFLVGCHIYQRLPFQASESDPRGFFRKEVTGQATHRDVPLTCFRAEEGGI